MLSNEEMRKAESFGWTQTDSDCCQWQREVVDPAQPLVQCYEMCQMTEIGDEYRVCHGIVAIGAVSDEELDVLVRMYGYDGLDDFVRQTATTDEFVLKADGTIDRENSPAWVLEQALLAEMDFETNALSEYMTDAGFGSETEAEAYIFRKILVPKATA